VRLRPHIIEVGNHAKILALLRQMAGGANLAWYDLKVYEVVRRWLLLASQHLGVARRLVTKPRQWRSTVSRSYYAAYNASRSVRYFVQGQVKLTGEDHQSVGELPNDFPNRASWSSFLTDLRKDRNIADYEPWPEAKLMLSLPPRDSYLKARELLTVSRAYLRGKGVPV
jgi:hypothetical protein